MSRFIALYAAIVALLIAPFAHESALAGGLTERVSLGSAGNQANNGSTYATISADGRYVAFASSATNLVPGDTNGWQDVFVRDTVTGATTCVSVSSTGELGDSWSGCPAISADGRYVAFESYATNLAPNCLGDYSQIFVHDRLTGATECVSIAPGATAPNDGDTTSASISADGRYVAFASMADTLVADDLNGTSDVFACDRSTGAITRVSVATDGTEADGGSYYPSISADGRFIAFQSDADNLAANDTNVSSDVFVRDRIASTTECVSVSNGGAVGTSWSGYPSISASGRWVAFASISWDLAPGVADDDCTCHVYVRDRQLASTERVSVKSDGTPGDGDSSYPSISANGRYVAFESIADNLVPGDMNDARDIFLHDRSSGITERDSVSTAGVQGDADSYEPVLSGDGRVVAFSSDAANLASGDTNSSQDVFIRARSKSASGIGIYAAAGPIGGQADLRAVLLAAGKGVPTRKVAFSVDGVTVGHAVTDDAGIASLPYVIPRSFAIGYHAVAAAFDGTADPEFNSSTRSDGKALLCRTATAISIYASTGTLCQQTTLRALLVSNGAAVAGRKLTFSVEGTPAGSGTTDQAGTASCAFTIPAAFATGMHNVTAVFDAVGDTQYAASSRTTSALLCRTPTTLSIYPSTGTIGQAVALKAILVGSGVPLAGKTVRFSVEGKAAGSGTTDSTGTAASTFAIPAAFAVGAHNVTATFGATGDTVYGASTRTEAALLCRAATSISIGASSGIVGQTVSLRALLFCAGKPVVGRTLAFQVDQQAVGAGVTVATGEAVCSYKLPAAMPVGIHNVTATFSATGDAELAPVTCTTPALTAYAKAATCISIYAATGVAGQTVTLRCLLYARGKPLAGKKVTFTVAGSAATASGTTDTMGVANATYAISSTMTAGVHEVTATFDGSSDPTYAATTSTTAALTVWVKSGTSISIYAAKGVAGQTASLRCLLYSKGKPVPGKKIAFTVAGSAATVSGTTNAAGIASATYAIPGAMTAGVHDVTASFDGSADPNCLSTSATTAALTVLVKYATSISNYVATGVAGQSVTLRCLLYSRGAPLSGKKITFTVAGSATTVSGTSDATGTASASYAIPASTAPGLYEVTSSFDGTSDPIYLSTSRTNAELTVK